MLTIVVILLGIVLGFYCIYHATHLSEKQRLRATPWRWWMREETVASMRKKGWNVHVDHIRLVIPPNEDCFSPAKLMNNKEAYKEFGSLRYALPYGGGTIISLYNPTTGAKGVGHAQCSLNDNYCRKEGVGIALDRAMEDAHIPKPEGWETKYRFVECA